MESFNTDQTSGILESSNHSEKVVKIITRFNELIALVNLKLLGRTSQDKQREMETCWISSNPAKV